MNRFGKVVMQLLEDRDMTVADLAEALSRRAGIPEVTEEDLLAIMTADTEEEFRSLMQALDEAVLHEN